MKVRYDDDQGRCVYEPSKPEEIAVVIGPVLEWLFEQIKFYESNAYSVCGSDEAWLKETAFNMLANAFRDAP